MTIPRAPKDLGAAGRSLWRSVLGPFVLDAGELETLRQACRVSDLLARLDGDLAGAELVVAGSTGQDRAHPLLAARAEQVRVLDSLLRSLDLRAAAVPAVDAAQQRWRARRGFAS